MSLEGSGASRGAGDGLHNEDAYLVSEGLGLYLVCDGASASPAGEVAARVASRAIEEFLRTHGGGGQLEGGRIAVELVEQAMTTAMSAVAAEGEIDADLAGLGTTLTMLLAQDRFGVIGHSGDSRAYLIRNENSTQLTLDDDETQQTSASRDAVEEFEVFWLKFKPNDTIILCTDGAEEVVQEDSIVEVAGKLGPRVLASRIVTAAHDQNPASDATAVVIRVRGEREPGWFDLSQPFRETAFGHRLQYA